MAQGTRRRRAQTSGNLHVTVETHAPTASGADQAVRRLASSVSGRFLQPPPPPPQASQPPPPPPASQPPPPPLDGIGSCELAARTASINAECCDEPSEDCSTGQPASCNVGCASVLIPFFADCSEALGKHASDYSSVVALCQLALDGKGRRLLDSQSAANGTRHHREVEQQLDAQTNSQVHALRARVVEIRAKARAAELDAARFKREAAELAQVVAQIEESDRR
jgi:hypothetical protein